MKKTFAAMATGIFMLGMGGVAQALTFGFTVVEDNSPLDPSSQFVMDVTDGGSGLTMFTFTNTGAIETFIADIYFDWADTALIWDSYSGTGEVDFMHLASPGDLSGGTNIAFTADWSTDAEPPPATWGIDNYIGEGTQDSLTIAFSGAAYDDIITALSSEEFRVGLHVQGYTDGESESYVSTGGGEPVPEPVSMLLFGTGLAGLAGARLRRKQ